MSKDTGFPAMLFMWSQVQLPSSHRVKDVFTSIIITQCSPPTPPAWGQPPCGIPYFAFRPSLTAWRKRDLGNPSRFTPISFSERRRGWALFRFHFILSHLSPSSSLSTPCSEDHSGQYNVPWALDHCPSKSTVFRPCHLSQLNTLTSLRGD